MWPSLRRGEVVGLDLEREVATKVVRRVANLFDGDKG